MIRFVNGSLFDSDAQTLVNPVNTVGVSGAGLAKVFKRRYPNAVRAYERAAKAGAVCVGALLFPEKTPDGKQILFFPTKDHWRDPSEMRWISDGLGRFAEIYREFDVTSVAFPALGCGNGGLEWREVKRIMTWHLGPLDIPISIYEPMAQRTVARR